MPLHLERESHQNCKQDPVGLKFLKCAPFFVSWIEGTSCTLLSQSTRPVLSLHHSHHKFPTFTATLHSLTTPHTPPYSYFSPHNTLSTPHSLATHSPLSHHTFLTLTQHNPHPLTTPISQHTHSRLSLQTPTFSFLPHHTLSILSTHHTPPTFTSKHSLTTHSHYHFTPHTPHSLNTPHTPNSLTTPHITNSLTAYSPLSHFTLPTFSPHTPHYRTTLSSHSLLSHPTTPSRLFHHTPQFLTSLPTFVPVSFRISLPTLSPHSPLFYFTSYSYKSQISFPTLEPHFATAHSHFHYALHSFTTLPHFSLYSSLSSHLIPNVSLSTFLSHSLYSLTTTPVPREDIEMRDGGVVCEHCIQGKYSPTFYFPFRLRCQRANLGLGEFQCFNFSL